MTALPVAFYLKDLSADASRRRGPGAIDAEGASDLDFRIREAHARGVLEGRAAVQAEQEAAAAAEAQAFAEKLAAERQAWAASEGERLGGLLAGAIADFERRISDLVSDALKPVLHAEVRARAIDALSRVLSDMLSKGTYARVVVTGPADLLARIEARLAAGYAGVSFVAGAGVDVTVNADETVLATEIGAWADAISGGER
jgi:hypothetical protein